MKAVFTTKYGSPEVLKIREVAKPKPKKNELLIKVKAIAVTSGDCRMRAFKPPFWYFVIPMRIMLGVFKPRRPIQGLWFSGIIVDKGIETVKYDINQEIYARTVDLKFGANAEYVCLSENGIISEKPHNLNHVETVSIPFGGITALYFLNKMKLKNGDKLLIYGASGSVGVSAVQLGKYMGAEVSAVCSTDNIRLVKENGADSVIDYKKKDLCHIKTKFDIVFDAVGKIDKPIGKKLLKRNGVFVSVLKSGHAKYDATQLQILTKLAESKFIKPVIDRVYSFEKFVDAHHYVEKGHKKGNVAVIVNEN